MSGKIILSVVAKSQNLSLNGEDAYLKLLKSCGKFSVFVNTPNRLGKIRFSFFPILLISLVGDLPDRTLQDLGEVLQEEIETIPSVLEAKIGGKRKLTIPPNMGYGNRDMGTIPANSTLIFEVDLLGIE